MQAWYVQIRPTYVAVSVTFQAVITELRGAVKKVGLDPASMYRIFSSLRNCVLVSQSEGAAYNEHAYAPLAHIFPALAVRVANKSENLLPSTSGASGANLTSEQVATKEAKSDKAVPVAVCPDGNLWKGSWEIATKTGLPDIDPSLKSLLHEEVGPLSRQLAYTYILLPRNDNIWNQLFTFQTGWLWGVLWWARLNTLLKEPVIKTIRPHQPEP
jgi:hypothetical protein